MLTTIFMAGYQVLGYTTFLHNPSREPAGHSYEI
jgi:hypothetical protein